MPDLSSLRFAVGIETMFTELPFEQRMEHVVANGFSAFEFWSREGKDMNITLALKLALRVEVSAFNGSSASLVDPAQHAKFEHDIVRAASLAVDLSCSNLVVHSGPLLPDVPRAEQRANMVKALKKVVPIAKDAGVTLVLEPLNQIEYNGIYLSSSSEGFQVIREVDSPYVRLLFNIYHQQMTEGNLTARILKNLDLIGYIRAADVPGRHEPGTGEINYAYIFRLLRARNFKGYVGLDYIPLTESNASLRTLRALVS
jgi:hydroxypyruvate isomerase